jgi:DNA-directed RNA polymerase subunit RPC12/RpoP
MWVPNIFMKKNKEYVLPKKINDQKKAECPYCHSTLKKVPARKTKCPRCGKLIFVKTRPKDRARVVVTEEQAKKIEDEWSATGIANEPFIGGEEEFNKEKDLLRVRFKGKEPSISDIKWGLLNKRASEAMKKSDFSALSGIYFQMALQKHEEGKDCYIEQVQAQKMQLMALKQNDVVSHVEILSKDGCEECKKLNEKKFTLEEALKNNPLPVAHCTHKLNNNAPSSWCRCTYLPVVSDDVDLKDAWLGDK